MGLIAYCLASHPTFQPGRTSVSLTALPGSFLEQDFIYQALPVVHFSTFLPESYLITLSPAMLSPTTTQPPQALIALHEPLFPTS